MSIGEIDNDASKAALSWEAWICPRCEHRNACRSYCGQCQLPLPSAKPAPDPPQPWETARARSTTGGTSSGRGTFAGLVVLVVVCLVAALALTRGTTKHAAAPASPAEWDARVTDVVKAAEQLRGLRFKHPVPVDFLTPEEWHKRFTKEPTDLTATDKADLERTLGLLRALGLAEGKFDVLANRNDFQDNTVLAFYDYNTKRITVRGTEVTVPLRVTLVHELTHALQDQTFDLVKLMSTPTDGAKAAVRGLVEGDAVRVETKYEESLSEADRQANEDARKKAADAVAAEAAKAPQPGAGGGTESPALAAVDFAPYELGLQFVNTMAVALGNTGIDDAFRAPPTSDEQMLDPFRYLAQDGPANVAAPKAPRGAKEVKNAGDFGAVSLYLLLAARMDPREALRAADGWGGDASITYVLNGRPCTSVAFAGDSLKDTLELFSALQEWAKTMPPGAVTIATQRESISFQSCDPGADAKTAGAAPSTAPLDLPALRALLAARLTAARNLAPAVGRCVSGALFDAYPIEEFQRPDPSIEFQRRREAFIAQCQQAPH
jgi:hypothetical protein